MKRLLPLVLAALVSLASPAWAYRPFDGTSAQVEDPGEFEVQIGPVAYISAGSQRYLSLPRIELDLGLCPHWELELEGRHQLQLGNTGGASASSLSDTELSLKTLWKSGSLQGLDGLSVATVFSVLLPTINDEKGAGIGMGAIVSQSWPELTLHLNAGMDLARSGNFNPFGGLILEGPLTWVLRPVAEVRAERELAAGATTNVAGLLGAILQIRHGLALDVAYHRTWAEQDSQEFRFGLTWEVFDTDQ